MGIDFIAPEVDSSEDLKIEVDYFTDQLRRRWPTVEISELEAEPITLEWVIKTEQWLLFGNFHGDPSFVAILGGVIEGRAAFAVWYRSIVPKKHRLFLYNTSTMDRKPFELREDTTEQQIYEFETGRPFPGSGGQD